MDSKYVVACQINTHKSALCNHDASLYLKYLTRHFHLSEYNTPKGLEPFKTTFKYKLSHELGPEWGQAAVDPNLLPDDPLILGRNRNGNLNDVDSDPEIDPAETSAHSDLNDDSIGSFQLLDDQPSLSPDEIKKRNKQFQVELREFLKKARNGVINDSSINTSGAYSNTTASNNSGFITSTPPPQ